MFSRNLCGIDCAAASRSPLTCSGAAAASSIVGPEGVVDLGGDAHAVILAVRRVGLARAGARGSGAPGPSLGELERAQVGGRAPRRVRSEAPEEIGPRRVEVPVLRRARDRVDEREPALDVARERHRDGVVEARDGRAVEPEQRLVGRGERRRIRALGVAGRDRRLELVRPGPAQRLGPLEHPQALVDRARVPEAAVLVGEQDELAVGRQPRVAARVLQQHQRQQPERLGLVGHQHAEELREPDRLAAEVAADERRARARRVALVEDEVEHAERGAEPVRQHRVRRHAERDPGRPDLPLRAHEPLRHRLLRDEERGRDLGRREAADLAQRERDLHVGGERRVAAGEHEREPLVGRAQLTSSGSVGQRLEPGEQRGLVGEDVLTPDPVDRAVAGGRDDPGARVVRHARPRPALERGREGVLHRVLGALEIAEDAGQDCDAPRPFLCIDRGEPLVVTG